MSYESTSGGHLLSEYMGSDASTCAIDVIKSPAKAYKIITITIRLRYDYDEKLTCSFFARVEWKQAHAMGS